MNETTSAAGSAAEAGGSARQAAAVKLWGIEIPIPAWAITPLAVAAVIAIPVFLFLTLYHMQTDASSNAALRSTKEALQKTNAELNGLEDRLRNARDDYEEYVKHSGEAGSDFHRESALTVKYYPSDGCLYVLRPSHGQWLRDGAKGTPPPPTAGVVGAGQRGELRQPWAPPEIELASALAAPDGVRRLLIVPAVYRPDAGSVEPPGGACLNPHPGKYESSNGEKKGCWLQVWRRWPDGCAHFQWFNTCTSYWQTDAQGNPLVQWTSCRH